MGGRINYEEELRKADEKLAELRKQKEERGRNASQVVSPQVSASIDVIRRQTEQLQKIVENSNQANVNLAPQMGMVSRLKKGLKVITAFDEYELVEKVGEGACGKVFSAKNAEGEEFAIKFLDRSIGKTKLKRFKNEIGFCEHNNHPNVVKVLDHGCLSLDGITYVFCVMPRYFESLRDKINKTIQPEDAIAIFVGLLSGLKFAHEKEVVHRDIKPENIMFAKGSNEPVICDFGIAHFSENDLMTFVETKPTDRLANFAYAAPEQRKKGVEAVPQTDLFAAGLILNEMFTKSIPQGGGYRMIKDVAPNYAFLDKIVERLYRNVPQERLFPEDKIISEMKVLAELEKNQKEAERLGAIVKETTLPEVIDLKVEDEKHTWICEPINPRSWCTHFSYDRVAEAFPDTAKNPVFAEWASFEKRLHRLFRRPILDDLMWWTHGLSNMPIKNVAIDDMNQLVYFDSFECKIRKIVPFRFPNLDWLDFVYFETEGMPPADEQEKAYLESRLKEVRIGDTEILGRVCRYDGTLLTGEEVDNGCFYDAGGHYCKIDRVKLQDVNRLLAPWNFIVTSKWSPMNSRTIGAKLEKLLDSILLQGVDPSILRTLAEAQEKPDFDMLDAWWAELKATQN